MRRRAVSWLMSCALAGTVPLMLLLAACAPREMTGEARRPAGAGEPKAASRPARTARDTAAAQGPAYRLEDELPEKGSAPPAQLVERLAPAKPDTIAERDIAIEQSPKARYGIGYRIQIFASGDRAAAERVRDRCVAETRLATYIEYEDGLYKVRAGDFAERKDAAQERQKIAGAYPGSWIVRTSIRR
jgi:hypothetical protein